MPMSDECGARAFSSLLTGQLFLRGRYVEGYSAPEEKFRHSGITHGDMFLGMLKKPTKPDSSKINSEIIRG